MRRHVPPKRRFFFDASDVQAELRGANGGGISARARADNDQIMLLCCHKRLPKTVTELRIRCEETIS